MAITKQQAIELMKVRGYGQVSEAGSGVWVGFSKDMNGIWMSAQVDLIKESVEMSGGILKMLCEIKTLSFDLHHKRFEEFEKMLYFYAKVCSYIDTFTEDERFIRRYTEVALDEYPVTISDTVSDTVKKIEKKDIKTRKREFWDGIVEIGKKRNYPKNSCKEFYDHWIQMNPGGVKLQFEITKAKKGVFDIGGRMATWMKNDKEWASGKKDFVEKKAEIQNKEIATTKTINKKDLF